MDEWDNCEYTYTVDTWDRVTLGTDFIPVNEMDHLEDDQTNISTDYDHISNLIQAGTKKLITLTYITTSLFLINVNC